MVVVGFSGSLAVFWRYTAKEPEKPTTTNSINICLFITGMDHIALCCRSETVDLITWAKWTPVLLILFIPLLYWIIAMWYIYIPICFNVNDSFLPVWNIMTGWNRLESIHFLSAAPFKNKNKKNLWCNREPSLLLPFLFAKEHRTLHEWRVKKSQSRSNPPHPHPHTS